MPRNLFIMPHGLKVDHENNIWVAVDDLAFLKVKHRGSDVLGFDQQVKVQTRLGRSGHYEGNTAWYHAQAFDQDEHIYVGDILGNTLQKFKKVTL